MKVNVIGLGYIGLPTALILAAHKVDVVGTDINACTIEKLNKREVTFEEQGLEELFKLAAENGIQFSESYQLADMYIIAVPTPYLKKDKKVDASYVMDAFTSVLEVCGEKTIIVIESTIAPGTINKYIRPLLEKSPYGKGKKIYIAHAPERIIPGRMIQELIDNPRIVGADFKEVGEQIKSVYQSFCKGEIVITDIRTAEMTKVVENTYRDINIAFANELAKICHSDNLDVYEIIKIANMHPRVNILTPGPGVGGHCISVDPWFLVGDYPGLANIILAARKINDSMPEFVLQRISEIMKERGMTDTSKVGFYGLTYKEDVDDLRESPTLQIIDCMEKHLAGGVKIYDPYIKENVVNNQYFEFETFLQSIDFIVIMVGHQKLKDSIKLLHGKVILDTKNVCDLPNTYKL